MNLQPTKSENLIGATIKSIAIGDYAGLIINTDKGFISFFVSEDSIRERHGLINIDNLIFDNNLRYLVVQSGLAEEEEISKEIQERQEKAIEQRKISDAFYEKAELKRLISVYGIPE